MIWLVTKGQSYATSVDYVPLPENVQQHGLKVIGEMQVS